MERLQVISGCPRLGLHKGDMLKVDTQPAHTGGGVYAIRVSWMHNGPHSRTLYDRLWQNHDEFNMNNGDPTQKVRVRKA